MMISGITEKSSFENEVAGRMVQYDEQYLSGPMAPGNDVPGPARLAQGALIRLGQQIDQPKMGQDFAVELERRIEELPQQIADNLENPPLVPKETTNWLAGMRDQMRTLAESSPRPDAAANAAGIQKMFERLLDMLDEQRIQQEVILPSVSTSYGP